MSKQHNFSTVFFQPVGPIILQTEGGWERGLDSSISLIKIDRFNGTNIYGNGQATNGKTPSLSSEFLFQYVGNWHPLLEKELVSFPVNWQWN